LLDFNHKFFNTVIKANYRGKMAGYSKFDSEKYLLETLERIAKNRFEYKALYVNISKLKPKNRHPRFVKIITRLFDDLVSIANSTMFVLNNGDFVILGKNITEKIINDAVDKLRRGLITDPIWSSRSSSEFTHIYLPEDFDDLYLFRGELGFISLGPKNFEKILGLTKLLGIIPKLSGSFIAFFTPTFALATPATVANT
jgi:hypothetical protein